MVVVIFGISEDSSFWSLLFFVINSCILQIELKHKPRYRANVESALLILTNSCPRRLAPQPPNRSLSKSSPLLPLTNPK